MEHQIQKIMKKLKPTFFASLLRRSKTEQIHDDSIFLEWEFNDVYLYVYARKENDFVIEEICIDDEIKLTKDQLNDLQKLVNSKIIEVCDPIDEYFENGVKPKDFY